MITNKIMLQHSPSRDSHDGDKSSWMLVMLISNSPMEPPSHCSFRRYSMDPFASRFFWDFHIIFWKEQQRPYPFFLPPTNPYPVSIIPNFPQFRNLNRIQLNTTGQVIINKWSRQCIMYHVIEKITRIHCFVINFNRIK